MIIQSHTIACVIASLAYLSIVSSKNKFQVCVVDGKGSFRKAARYCPILDGPDSKVECVIGLDRLDCLRRIAKGKADFSVFTPEDLVTATNLKVEVLVTNEMRFTKDPYEYQVVAVIDDNSGIKTRYDLRDKQFCHPGYGYEADWTKILANYLEISVVPQTCNPSLTLTENRIRASSLYFKKACKAGPWVNEPILDENLKKKYPNLCELCHSPTICSNEDKYWGRRGSLLCLTDGVGDITWARLDDVRNHFGLTPGSEIVAAEGYSFLCPDDTIMPVHSANPCIWVSKPWPVIATKRTSAQDIQQFISTLSHVGVNSWQSALLKLIETYQLTIENVEPIEAIESYLAKATGFLNANSFPGCHPPRTIRMCTTSNLENSKCGWLREATTVYGIEPGIDCLKADNKSHCLEGIANNLVDMVILPPDMIHKAKSEYDLKPLFYETVDDSNKYITVAIVKANSGIQTIDDLKGKKACFPTYDGIAWNSVLNVLNKQLLFKRCPYMEGMADFFSQSCVPNLPKGAPTKLKSMCVGDTYDGDYGALRCLTRANADVAFVSKNTFLNFFEDLKQKGDRNLNIKDYKVLCGGKMNPCHLSWAGVGQAMVKSNVSDLWFKDSLDVFLQMDTLFGKNIKSLTAPLTMFGIFDENSNVLFHDSTAKLRDVPRSKNTDLMTQHYDKILSNMDECKAAASPLISSIILVLVSVYLSLL